MSGFEDPAFFGERWADVYDDGLEGDPGPAVDFLAERAKKGRVLELAIGTGRVALPLARRGIAVEGVEASEAMVDRLRQKPGGSDIPVVIGDMADVPVEGTFTEVYLVFNTLFNLITQERQLDCFRNVASVLEPGGVFVIECFVPDLTRYANGQQVEATAVGEDSVTMRLARLDRARQHFTRQYVTLDANGFRMNPVLLRYCWPSELDLMARLAGLRLVERHAGWDRTPFGSDSSSHISVYEKPIASAG